MSRTLTASDRSALIRLASTLPAGSPEKKAILAGLSKSAGLASERKAARTPAHVLDHFGYDPFDISLQDRDEELSDRMKYAGGLIEQYAKKSITERVWAIQYGLDRLADGFSGYSQGVHRAGGDWSDWRDAYDALEKAQKAVDKLHRNLKYAG